MTENPYTPFDPVAIEQGLQTRMLGRTIFCFGSVGSTNDRAHVLAESGAVDGTLILAEEQTRGRGRRGRDWHSSPGRGIWLSLILRPEFPATQAPGLSLVAGLSLAETIEDFAGISAEVKWPNDCLVNNKKTAGILTELSAEKQKINYIVLGMGVNLAHRNTDFPPELRDIATSVEVEANRAIDRVGFLQNLLLHLEKNYDRFSLEGLTPLIEPYSSRCNLIGCQITTQIGAKSITGKALRIDDSGALVIESNGRETPLTAGEITQIRK